MKPKTKRNRAKFASLNKTYSLKTRSDLLDYDYLDKLSQTEKDWLARFTEEYTHANLKHAGKTLHKKKKYVSDIYNRNNARNRDIYTRESAMGNLTFYGEKIPEFSKSKDVDDTMDKMIDLLEKGENFEKPLNTTKKRKNSRKKKHK